MTQTRKAPTAFPVSLCRPLIVGTCVSVLALSSCASERPTTPNQSPSASPSVSQPTVSSSSSTALSNYLRWVKSNFSSSGYVTATLSEESTTDQAALLWKSPTPTSVDKALAEARARNLDIWVVDWPLTLPETSALLSSLYESAMTRTPEGSTVFTVSLGKASSDRRTVPIEVGITGRPLNDSEREQLASRLQVSSPVPIVVVNTSGGPAIGVAAPSS